MKTLEIGTMPDYLAAIFVGLFALAIACLVYMMHLALTAYKSEDGNNKKALITTFVLSLNFVLSLITGIGAGSTVAFDTVRRYFEYRGYEVAYISNFTDVDDKIINRAKEEGITPQEVADKYIAAFREDVTALGVKPATRHPRVVEFMADIIRFVEDLIEKGFAYESQGDVYFRVEKSHNYAKLANKTLEDLELGASGRTDEETARKENPVDFALWKSAKSGEISWDSPWDLVVRAGTSSVQSCQQRFWATPLIFTVVELT